MQQQHDRPRLAAAAGFTLTELMLAVALVGILSVFALPAFRVMIKDSCLTTTSNEMLALFRYARSEAIKRKEMIIVSATPEIWTVRVSGGDDLRESAPPCTAEIKGPGQYIILYYLGARGEPNEPKSISICDDRTGEEGREIKVSRSGRAAVTRKTCA